MRSHPPAALQGRVHPQLPNGPRLDVDAGDRVDHTYLDPRQRSADRPRAGGIVMILGQQVGVSAEGLGLAEYVGKPDMRKRRYRLAHQRARGGRGAVGDGDQRRQVGAGKVGMFQDPMKHRRHQEHAGHPML